MLHVAMLDSPTEQSIHDTLSSICFRVETPECINAASITLFKPYTIQTPSMTCAQILEPLFAFKALKTFEVDFFHMHTFTDEDARRIVSAWPKLTAFTHCSRRSPARTPSVCALIEFAQHCPELELLTLYFDVSNLPSSTPYPRSDKAPYENCKSRP